jgi:Biotin-requiring enzyme
VSATTRCFSVLLSQRYKQPQLCMRDSGDCAMLLRHHNRSTWPAIESHIPRCLVRPMSTATTAAELPYHLVVGLPALSPTMESGTLAEWYLKEGDSFSAGAGLAKIETDKAAMDFEAQDDGFVAKILIPAGGNDGTLFHAVV